MAMKLKRFDGLQNDILDKVINEAVIYNYL